MTGNGNIQTTLFSKEPTVFPQRIGNYAIEEQVLGVGTSASVRLGTHILTGEKVT
jgi:hypothetical protein